MILVTGATGFIGRNLVQRLVAEKEQTRCLVRDSQKAAQALPSEVDLVTGNTTTYSSLPKAVEGIDTIIHASFMTADRKESAGNRYEQTNVQGTANLIKAAKEAGVKRIIEISGLGTKPDKKGSYMQGRYLSEKMLMESGLQWTIIRPSVLFGDGAPFVTGLADLVQSAPVVPLIGGGKTMFQPIFVEDVVTVITKVLAMPEQYNSHIYTIGGPEYYSFSQIFDILLQATGKRRPKVYAPMPLVALGAIAMEAVLPRPPITKAALTLFSFDNTTDLNSVSRDFGFTPISFRTYMKEHGVH